MCFCKQDGWTALHLAAQEGKVDMVRLLTEAGAHLNIQNEVYIALVKLHVSHDTMQLH